jgi:hypothetical protein
MKPPEDLSDSFITVGFGGAFVCVTQVHRALEKA